MLFLLFGSSASGKTSALDELRGRVEGLAVHDFDEIGVPPGADTAWRHRANEQWVQRALEYQAEGKGLLLGGQMPFGELLATPSAPGLEAISGCLVDCDDDTRIARLEARGPEWIARVAGDLQDEHTTIERHLNWADWMRRHAADPTWRTDVIRTEGGAGEMHWPRWAGWRAGDPRWRVQVIDTTDLPIAEVAAEVAAWIEAERGLFRSGTHPLVGASLAER